MNNSRDNVVTSTTTGFPPVVCNIVFRIKGPKGAVCVGYTEENCPPDFPSYDPVHLCILRSEDLQRSEEEKRCHRSQMISATPEEATGIGVSLIKAATLCLKAAERKEKSSTEAPDTRRGVVA